MLERVLDFIHNYFIKEIHRGRFSISDNHLSLTFLQNGQYFMIRGSVFNDGLHQYPDNDLSNETFCGEIWVMAVPAAVVALANEIEEWQNKYSGVVSSPYQSESFGGYSYTKATSSSSATGGNVGWENIFRSRLNRWRKIS